MFTSTVNPLWMLERTFRSLQSQTHQNLQWILISDGSTEDVQGFVDSINAPFEIILINNEIRQGKFISYNKALELASKDFFCILDDDDELYNQSIEKLLDAWNDIPFNDQSKFWGVAGTSKTPGVSQTGKLSKGELLKSPSGYAYRDSSYDEMKFKFGDDDERFSLNITEIVKRFPYDPVTFHIPPSTVWSTISRKYLMRYTDMVVRIYHHSPNGIMSRQRTYQVLLQRTLGIVLWTADDLNHNIKYFRSAPRYFLKSAFNYLRFSMHLKSQKHKVTCPANYNLGLENRILKKIQIRNFFSFSLILLVSPAAIVWYFLDTKRN